MKELLTAAAVRAARYVSEAGDRRVAPLPEDVARLGELGGTIPARPSDPAEVLRLLEAATLDS
jgi:hypothetical protein